MMNEDDDYRPFLEPNSATEADPVKKKRLPFFKIFAVFTALLLVSVVLWNTVLDVQAVRFNDQVEFVFADREMARELLLENDEYLMALTSFDRSAAMRRSPTPSRFEYLEFLGACAREWKLSERLKIADLIEEISGPINAMNLNLPETIFLVRTSGKDVYDCAYTRGNSIFFPLAYEPGEAFKETLAHEIFHVASRFDRELRDTLYAAIGYTACNDIIYPESLASRIFTNPDAVKNEHFITINDGDGLKHAVPVLYSDESYFDPTSGNHVLVYLQPELIEVEQGTDGWSVVIEDGWIKRIEYILRSDYYDQVGYNKDNIFKNVYHPDEILADYFDMIVMGREFGTASAKVRQVRTLLYGKELLADEIDIVLVDDDESEIAVKITIGGEDVFDYEELEAAIKILAKAGIAYAWFDGSRCSDQGARLKVLSICRRNGIEILKDS